MASTSAQVGRRPRLAVVGAGIAGLASAYWLQHAYDVTVYEANPYLGGHINTVEVESPHHKQPVPIDTGFMVMNPVTYPNLTRLFHQLGVGVTPTDMSFSVQHQPAGLEFAGAATPLLFGQRRNLFRPRYWAFLAQLASFNAKASQAWQSHDPILKQQTLEQWCRSHGWGDDLLNWYLLPMSSAIWSTHPTKMLDFPAYSLVRFFHNHGFLGQHTQYQWYTLLGGAKTLAGRLKAATQARFLTQSPVAHVAELPQANTEAGEPTWSITTEGSHAEPAYYHAVVMATHADTSLSLLANPSDAEVGVLGAFAYERNTAILHTQGKGVLPKRKHLWAAWNYRLRQPARKAKGSLISSTHYYMNKLQHISGPVDYVVSINDAESLDPAHWVKEIQYTHPQFTPAALQAQTQLPQLNRDSWAQQAMVFCGSYARYGFHEDAFSSALTVTRLILGERHPWGAIPANAFEPSDDVTRSPFWSP